MDALLFNKVEEMQALQANNAEMEKEIEEFNKETSSFKYQNNKKEMTTIIIREEYKPSSSETGVSFPETDVDFKKVVTVVAIVWRAISWLFGLFW